MAVLTNSRHERFAQELAAGKSQQQAYVSAGYKAHLSNPSALAKDKRIQARVAELLREREEIHSQATAKAIESQAITKTWIIAKLRENAERALQAIQARDADGNPVGDYKYEGSVANRALELLGKELGMFIDRKEIGAPGEFDRMSDEDLARFVAQESARIGKGMH